MARRRRNLGCALLAVAAFAAVAPAAAAQGEGIRVDPDSPSGTEYQLPLERARQDAQQGGRPSSVQPGARTAPAFGEGITPAAKKTTGATGTSDASGSGTASKPTPTTPQATGAGGADPPGAPAPAKAADGPGNLLLEVGAIAGAVLLLGGAIGLLLRGALKPR